MPDLYKLVIVNVYVSGISAYKAMSYPVYHAKCFNSVLSCLEGVPLKVLKELCYCSWLSRIFVHITSGSLSAFFCEVSSYSLP